MSKIDCISTVKALDNIFRFFGYPTQLVSDNGPPYNSKVFEEFCNERGIRLTHTPPYHPSSNGQVERAVQTTKTTLKKFVLDAKQYGSKYDLPNSLREFLRNYNNLPCTEEGFVPSHRMFAFKPKTNLDLLKIEKEKKISIKWQNNENGKDKQKNVTFLRDQINNQESNKVQNKKLEEFKPGEMVLYLINNRDQRYIKWCKAKILERESEVVYKILVNNLIRKAHVNQLRKTILKNFYDCTGGCIPESYVEENQNNNAELLRSVEGKRDYENSNRDESNLSESIPRKSSRVCKPPIKFKDYYYN